MADHGLCASGHPARISPRSASEPVQISRRKRPVQMLRHGSNEVVGTAVLIVQVIRMLPHVHRQQRREAPRERRFRVARLDDRKLALVKYEPAPATAEL